ncbi:hypothetical protein [Erwinia sp. 198]|uniref:hypothetical protein n=1 Tax=Erwinia sp. 198 TaxID=2022746 RepID=UPI001F1E89F2|nr:hypothetical protein [Erwinia sp. 198]
MKNLKSFLFALLPVISFHTVATSTAESAVIQVENTVEKNKLVPDAACVNYLITEDAEPGLDLVDVVEKHGGNCPGDPETQPRLFSVYVDQKTKQMISDKDDPVEGDFTLLVPDK